MKKTIHIKEKNIYGHIRLYPDCELSRSLVKLTRYQKTFSEADLDALREAGYEVKVEKEK